MGKALELAFGTMFRNPLTTFGSALLLSAIPGQLFQTYIVGPAPAVNYADPASLTGFIFSALGGVGLTLILGLLVQAVLVRATIAHAQGEKATLAEGLTDGIGVILPLLGLSILMYLGIFLGLVLLIVPGIMLFVMWYVAAPALVVEQQGVFAAFARSRFLTSGIRWRIFGLAVLLLIIQFVLGAAIGVTGVAGGLALSPSDAQISSGVMVISVIASTISTTLQATVASAVYVQLRNWKDGPDSTRLEDIFA